jgi:hypothetical protein
MGMDCDDTNWIGPVVIMLIVDYGTSCVEPSDCLPARLRKK